MRTPSLTTVLELAGVALLVAFAGLVWWPAAFGVAGVACLVLSWALERRPAKPRPVDEVDVA